jgi:cytochrome c biogenesis protein CcmG/thiol:disulfide interchange protein DsbE
VTCPRTDASRPPGGTSAGLGARGHALTLVLVLASLLAAGTACAAGKAAPFRVRDLGGRTLDLETLRHRGPVLLEFWATWCAPCRAAFPELEALQQEYGERGLTVIGVSADGPRNVAKVRPFVARERLTFPIALDLDGRMQQIFQVGQLPTAVLIDTNGVIVASRVGFRAGETTLRDHVTALFAPAPATAPADSGARTP